MKSKDKKEKKTNKLREKFDTYFILEQYILYQRIQWIKKIEESKTLDYKEIGKDMLLQNLFLKKIRLDPGFRFKIYHQLGNDKDALRKIKRILIPFFQEKEFFTYQPKMSKSLKEDLNMYEDKHKIENLIHYTHPQMFTSPFFSTELKKYWFYERWRSFMKFGKKQESYASESMLLELITGYHYGHYLFWTSNPYGQNRNGHHFYLAALKEVTEILDPYFLDYIDAQRGNILVCERMQNIIDILDYNNLNDDLEEYVEHFQDIIENKLNLLEKVKIEKDLLKIVSLIYFNFLSFSERIDLLNKFYGIDELLDFLDKNQGYYAYDNLIGDLPDWYFFGFLPNLRDLLLYNIDNIDKNKEIDHFILIKYLCKSYIEENKFDEALQLLFSETIPFLQECREVFKNSKDDLKLILDPSSRIHIELLYLLAIISIKTSRKNIFNFVIKIYNFMIELSEDINVKHKIQIIKSITYRMNKKFNKEREILDEIDINPKQLIKDNDTNPFEIHFSLFPPNLIASESFHYENNTNFMHDFKSSEILEREPLFPSRHELYLIYADFRKKYILNSTEDTLFYFDNHLELVKYVNRSLNSQSMASFNYIHKLRPIIDHLAKYEQDSEGLRILSETLAFPFIYLRDFNTAIEYLNDALYFKPDDTYYNKYLIILHLFKEEYALASKFLFKLYHIGDHSSYQKISGNIKSLFQFLMIWFKEDNFHRYIMKMLSQSQYITKFVEKLDIIYCDIGLSLADLGYFDVALKYFNKALDIVQKEEFKALILSNIGTVYSDLIQLDKAIEKFEEAIDINPNNPMFWLNLSKMYQFRLNYLKAKQIYLDSMDHFRNIDEKIADIMHAHSVIMDMHIQGIVNLNIVHENDALTHFKLAEELIKNLHNLDNLTENTGIIFIELTNGVDCCFHAKFSKIFQAELEKNFIAGATIPNKVWYTLPLGLREIWKGKHMSMGHIEHLIDDILAPNLTLLLSNIKKKLLKNVDLEDLKIIQEFAKLSTQTRNPSGHGGILNKTEFINNISDFIEAVNKTLIVFEKFY